MYSQKQRNKSRSKWISKTRANLFGGIPRSLTSKKYGRTNMEKLSTVFVQQSNAAFLIDYSYDIDNVLRVSNDWANFQASYAFYNIHKVKIQVFPINKDVEFNSIGICYNPTVSASLTNINQITDHKYSKIFTFSGGSDVINFTFPITPNLSPPQKTTTASTAFGWMKIYAPMPLAATIYTRIVATFYVSFGMAQ